MDKLCALGRVEEIKDVIDSYNFNYEQIIHFIDIACKHDHLDVVKIFLRDDASIMASMHFACKYNKRDIIDYLFIVEQFEVPVVPEVHELPDGLLPWSWAQRKLDRAFISACEGGHKELILEMMQKGIKNYWRALIKICENGHVNIIEHLIFYCNDYEIEAAYYYACKNGHLKCVEYLEPFIRSRMINPNTITQVYQENQFHIIEHFRNVHIDYFESFLNRNYVLLDDQFYNLLLNHTKYNENYKVPQIYQEGLVKFIMNHKFIEMILNTDVSRIIMKFLYGI